MTHRPNLASTLPGFALALLAILATITKADDAHPVPALIEFEQSATAAKQALADQRSTLLDDIRNDPLASNITLGRIQPDAVNALIEQRTLNIVLPTTPGTAQRAAKRSTNIPAPIVFTGVALTHHTNGMIGIHAADDPTGNETQIVIDGNDVVGWIRIRNDGRTHKLHPLGNGLTAVYEYDTSQLRRHPPNWRPDAYRKTDQRNQQRNAGPATPVRSERSPPDRINELMRERTKRFRQRSQGQATGDARTSDNRRVLTETAQRVANYRQSKPQTQEPAESNTLIIPYIPVPVPDQSNQAFISFENRGEVETDATAQLYDEHGSEIAFVTISLPSGTTRWVNSEDLVDGNPNKGVSVTSLQTPCDDCSTLWARVTADNLVSVYAYLRSPAGFLATMSRTAETTMLEDGRNTASLPFFNPGSNTDQQSVLRLVNSSEQERTVIIRARDGNGEFGGDVRCKLKSHSTLQLTAAALEAGPANRACTGKWGDGKGKWYVEIEDKAAQLDALVAMSLLHSVKTGLVSNMSNPELTVTGETVDLMILYTPAARTRAGNIGTSIQNLINETNRVYDNSRVDLTVQVVHTQQVNYIEQATMSDDINNLRNPKDLLMDEVHFLRNKHGADLVVLITVTNQKGICGLAFAPDFRRRHSDDHSDAGFSVIDLDCSGAGIYTMAHEIGHNLGMDHDPKNVSGQSIFKYGHGYCNPKISFYIDDRWHTVMSYKSLFGYPSGCLFPIAIFSNPIFTFRGQATGDAHTSDNRRVLTETAQRVANYRQSKFRTQEPTESNTLIIPYIPVPSDQLNQAFISFQNHGEVGTDVTAQLYDEHGSEIAFVTMLLPSETTRWVNSKDLLKGNSSKGVLVTSRQAPRSLRLWARVTADNHVSAYAYLRSPKTGFVTTMSRTAETIMLKDGRNTASLPFFNPGSNTDKLSVLRLVNPSARERTVIIRAWDGNGDSGDDIVECTLDPYSTLQLTAAALEAGPANRACTGKWGDGKGKWYVEIEDKAAQLDALVAMSLLHSVGTGLISNMSNPELTPIGETASPPPPPPPPPPPGIEVGEVFRDCVECPELVVVPAGTYMMGSPPDEEGRSDSEGPQHEVTIEKPFAVGVNEVTFEEWDACVSGGGCRGYRPRDQGGRRGTHSVMRMGWRDVQAYVEWLRSKTGEAYRLLSESEWEYVARAGTNTRYSWGNSIGVNRANCDGCGSLWDRRQVAPVRSFGANGFGVYDMHGNVWEWVQDCWNGSYRGAPADGSAWDGDCDHRVVRHRVVRGGAWYSKPRDLRSANRSSRSTTGYRHSDIGFRIARTLTP